MSPMGISRQGRLRGAASALTLLLLTAACGGPKADRIVEVAMTDNAFNPGSFSVNPGETITFKFTNNGSVDHDAFIGDAAAQKEHGDTMASSGDGGHNHGAAEALTLGPGKSDELTYTFDESGEILLGCHQPGHFEAGMKSTITVA